MGADLAAVAAFTGARLAELEAAARAAAGKRRPPWRAESFAGGLGGHVSNSPEGASPSAHDRGHVAEAVNAAVAAHIALNDPAHALRVARFGRTLLACHGKLARPKSILERVTFPALAEVVNGVILDFAQIWEKHPEFKEGWKP